MSLIINSPLAIKGYIESEIGGRSENQDSAGALDTDIGTVIVVCDGMGGMRGGKTASMIAVKTIIDYVAQAKEDDSPEEVLITAFKHAHEAILAAGNEDSDLKGMGTTGTAIIISKKSATVAHLGDSRIYQLRRKKKVFRTFDHSMVFQLVKAGTITEEQARLSANSNYILKALGVGDDVVPDTATLPFLRGDRFVLCTDGFWGAYCEKDFIKAVTKKKNIKELLWDMSKEVNKIGIAGGGGHDNYTAAVVDVNFESKIKTRMSTRLKVFVAAILLLLAASVYLNWKSFGYAEKINVAREYALQLKNGENTAKDSLTTKFIETFDSSQKELKDTTNVQKK